MRGRIELVPGVGFALTTNAMVRYQDASGETIFEGFKMLEQGDLDVRRLRLIVWAGLEDRARSVEDAGDLIDTVGLKPTGQKLIEAAKAAFPDVADGEPGNATAPER